MIILQTNFYWIVQKTGKKIVLPLKFHIFVYILQKGFAVIITVHQQYGFMYD